MSSTDTPSGFSQYGEDLILWEFFRGKVDGFFVDVGANHPTALSNTWFFEQRGWRGILVEPIPERAGQLRAARPASRVVETALGAPEQRGQAVFKLAEEDVLSGLNPSARVKCSGEITVRVVTLDDVLNESGNPRVDFVSIDVEGTELEVLRGFDLARHQPKVLLVEDHWRQPVHQHLCAHGYKIVRRTGCNSWYVPRAAEVFPGTPAEARRLGFYLWWRLPLRLFRLRLKERLRAGFNRARPA